MEFLNKGTLKGSHIYFYTPSQSAKRLLYYPIAAGEFYCGGDYAVKRTRYDSILLLSVLDGSMNLLQNGNQYTAQKGELLLVDCYLPHQYFTLEGAHTMWLHFDGNNSRQWFDEIVSKFGQKIKCAYHPDEYLSNIIRFIRCNQNEFDLSGEIYALLLAVAKGEEPGYESKKADYIKRAKRFMLEAYAQNLTVEQIAGVVNMSASFFSKLFKESTGFSPYDYLLTIRLDKAKELLQKTDDSVQNIAFKTGFNSASNFIYFFKKATGLSPLKFRKIEF